MIPAWLAREIRTKFGPYSSDDHSKVGIAPVMDIATFRSRLLAAVRRKTDVIKWLMKREEWDLFLSRWARFSRRREAASEVGTLQPGPQSPAKKIF